MSVINIDGPYFEDFTVGDEFSAPSITLTEGYAALYQAMMADRMRLPLDHALSRTVTGRDAPLAHPHLVINVVNGQTTYASQHVKGNLFYRGLIVKQPVYLGDTLSTTTKVVALRQNQSKPGRDATGMVALEMSTHNQHGDQVMQYWRCPMIPCRDPQAQTDRKDDLSAIGREISASDIDAALPTGWDLGAMASEVIGLKPRRFDTGDKVRIVAKDTITCAPELVRLTLNIAYTHVDATKSYLGKRLVYGGHTISLVLAQLTRALPSMVSVIAWAGCDHTGPVIEDDLIETSFEVTAVRPAPAGGELLDLHVLASASRPDPTSGDYVADDVLDWRLTVWCAS